MIPQEKLDALKQTNLGRPLSFNEIQGYVVELRRNLEMYHHSVTLGKYDGVSLAIQKMVGKFIFVEPQDPSKTYLNAAASVVGQKASQRVYGMPGVDLDQSSEKRKDLWKDLPAGEKVRAVLLLSTTYLSRWPIAFQDTDKDFFHFLMDLGAKAPEEKRL